MTPPRFILTYPSSPRHFALLDQNGICLGFKSCRTPPVNGNWVSVNEIRLCWLHHPLPANVRKNAGETDSALITP
ncbi:hypothetical protein HX867_00150 [Pseudomonas gingeri]|nr:hypothetical protein [Pseudomonas gingeri]NVZ60480.1 hypothetical protein [Pseudomonas gingeri]NVZ74241.1 hypothetical protein [Pseudomonas gingeri]NWE48058.1 hypothetical protein [Pseudomonas gingeri]